jgi:hypothetical protein
MIPSHSAGSQLTTTATTTAGTWSTSVSKKSSGPNSMPLCESCLACSLVAVLTTFTSSNRELVDGMTCLARYCGMHLSTDGILSLLFSSSTPQHFFSLSDPTSASFLFGTTCVASIGTISTPASRLRFSVWHTHHNRPRSLVFLFLLAPTLNTTEHTLSSMLNTHHYNSGFFWSFFSLSDFWHPTPPSMPYHTPTSRMPQFFDAHTHHHHHNSGKLDTCFFMYCFGSRVNVAVGFGRSPFHSAWLADLCRSWVARILG